jgi:nitrogen-specific signal transduction histidine kinase/ActR/RegA family two-component response regulator
MADKPTYEQLEQRSRDLERTVAGLEVRIQQAQKMESIGNLAGGIAHDFNNILFAVVGMSELLLDDLVPGTPEHENAQEILLAGKRGRDLANQILAFCHQSEQKMIPVRFQQVLREVFKLVRSTIPANFEISKDIQNDCGLMLADPTQLHQVAMNLITNAYHAVEPDNGKISVELKEIVVSPDVTGSPLAPGRYALFCVSDTGCGIDPLIMDRIYDPYFTTKSTGKGTGLGLAVVYGIVKAHHGDIRVSSVLGQGAQFSVYLPLLERPAAEVQQKTMESLGGGHEKILLVDDDHLLARLEKQMLERLGYHVTVRVNSLEALEAFRANPGAYDLVMTDMAMPNMTGDQLARKLIAIQPDLPVIICTGFSERIDQCKAAELGIKGFLMKPIVRSEMAQMVRSVCDAAAKRTAWVT